MSRIYEKFYELLSAHIEADEKWMPIQKAHELLGSVNEDEIWEQRHAAADALFTYIAELEAFIDQLIEAGDAVINAEPMWIAEEDKWDALVKDWKERKE